MSPVDGPSAWLGSRIDYRDVGLQVLTGADLEAVDHALDHLRGLGPIDFPAITPTTFPLGAFGATLAALGDRLRDGPGFVLLRGLPRERYALDDLARIYVGIGAHIGRLLPQSYHGELLGHVIDVSDIEEDARGYHAGGAQNMHTDTCDIVSLMCIRAARSGGASRIVSAAAVHNRLLEERPDLLARLYDDITCRRWALDAELGSGVFVKDVVFFSRAAGALTCNLSGSYPRRAVEHGDSVMTPLLQEALDALQRLARSPEFYLDMTIGEGDIQFLNNRAILHGRTGYEDWPSVAERRHLMRLWLELAAWPAMPVNQGMHTAADHRGWLRQRTPFMEVPSRYLAAMTQRKAERVA
jgi:hypothetical protein